MRKALESEIASAGLPRWIDLVWGFTQRGYAPIGASSVYMAELSDDIWDNEDVSEKRKTEIMAKLINIGQVPAQLFLEPHPSKAQQRFLPAFPACTFATHKDFQAVFMVGWQDGHVNVVAGGSDITMNTFNVGRSHEFEKTERVLLGEPVAWVGLLREIVFLHKSGSVFCGRQLLFTNSHGIKVCGEVVASIGDTSINVLGPLLEYTIPFFGDPIAAIAVSTDFHTIAASTQSGRVVLCDLAEGKKVRTFASSSQRRWASS
jgi:hypothetical protein